MNLTTKTLVQLLAACITTGAAQVASPALVARGTTTLDTATGLEWLDLTLSFRLSVDEVRAQVRRAGLDLTVEAVSDRHLLVHGRLP